MKEISFFRMKNISTLRISAYQNLVSNAPMKVLLKIKHVNNSAYKTKIEYKINLRTETIHIMQICVFL